MKRKMLSRLMAASLAAIMTVGMVGCGNETADDNQGGNDVQTPTNEGNNDVQTPPADDGSDDAVEPAGEEGLATVEIDPQTGEPWDLGGMEIIIADWWSPDEPAAPTTDFGEAELEYHEWLQETYNFTMKRVNWAGWGDGEGSIGERFVQVATSAPEGNIIYTLCNMASTASAVQQGLMYDITKLDGDVIDLSEKKWTQNGELDSWSLNGKYYGFYTGPSEPRGGLYFNKTVLKDAGIDPDTIYDMQANGTWTWDAWVDIMSQVQRDIDNDGVTDVYGCVQNNGGMIIACVRSNGANLVEKAADGSYVLTAGSDAVSEGLHFAIDTVTNQYFLNYGNEDGSNWEEYKERFMNGEAAFMYDDAYCAYDNGWLSTDSRNVDFGFVMFPKGPKGSDYVMNKSNNPIFLPANYDDDTARKIMFAFDVWTDDVPGWEGYYGLLDQLYGGMRDTRAVDETIAMAADGRGMDDLHALIPGFDPNTNFLWALGVGADVDAVIEQNLAAWQSAVDEANAKMAQ